MERKTVYQSVFSERYCDETFEISEFVELIKDVVSKGATHMSFSSEDEYSGCKLSFEFKRLETDKEFNDRVQYEEHMKNYWIERDLKELNRLKEKYNQ